MSDILPLQSRCVDACPTSLLAAETRTTVAVNGSRLEVVEDGLCDLRTTTETKLDKLQEEISDFRNQQAETNGKLVGDIEQLLRQTERLSRLLIDGNGQPSVMSRLSDVEHQFDNVEKGLTDHVTTCEDRHNTRRNFGIGILQTFGAIVAAVAGGVVTYLFGH